MQNPTSGPSLEGENESLEISFGSVRFGDLRRPGPISPDFGEKRGTPIDRFYIEGFLARHADDIRGRVLELQNSHYTKCFGGARVTRSDVLTIETTNPNATIVGDVAQADTLPEAAFDCIIFTQTLQYIYEPQVGIGMLHRALKPGGVLLVTAPGIAPMGDHPGHPEKPDVFPWYWSFTMLGLSQLLKAQFGPNSVDAESHGNIFAATAFLYGIAWQELDVAELDVRDSRFPVTIAARAIKRAAP
jgi:SAM-dependent methyltransferase